MNSTARDKKVILVVDDAEENLMILDEVLKNDYKVISAQSGKEALEILKFRTPDIILLDIIMPYMDGFQTCKIIKADKHTANIPIIFLSAVTNEKDQLKGFQLGASDYLLKPINQSILMAKLRVHLNEKDKTKMLEKKIHDTENELNMARIEIIRRLETATGYKDAITADHINRMSRYCYAIAIEYGFNNKDAEILLNASSMHDIGKIGIPDSILLKPGKLNDEEWKVMATHSEIGANIINSNSSELMNIAHIVAYQHHEKWNGTGYPLGLKEEEININSRIAAVADVFDALTSDRPYRKAWDVDKAINHINRESGEHFDPDVVTAFNNAIDEILFIRESCNNQLQMHDIIECVMEEI